MRGSAERQWKIIMSAEAREPFHRPFAKESAVKTMFRFAVLSASLLFCLGCGEPAPTGTDAETEQLYESEEYEQQMMGQMGEEPAEGGGATE